MGETGGCWDSARGGGGGAIVLVCLVRGEGFG